MRGPPRRSIFWPKTAGHRGRDNRRPDRLRAAITKGNARWATRGSTRPWRDWAL